MVPSNEIFYLEKAKVADYFFVTFTENSLVVYLEVCSVWTFWTFGIEVKTIMKENKRKMEFLLLMYALQWSFLLLCTRVYHHDSFT